jgi:hypothetical protein
MPAAHSWRLASLRPVSKSCRVEGDRFLAADGECDRVAQPPRARFVTEHVGVLT